MVFIHNARKIKQMLKQHNFKANKRFGQNFLINQQPIDLLISSAKIQPNDIVLEIGPGLGALTLPLANKAKQIIAVEKDKGLCLILTKLLEQEKIDNVKIINGDVLNFQFSISNFQTIFNFQFLNADKNKYKVVANLPYNIATAIIMKFLETENPPEIICVLLQKEVAQRIISHSLKTNKLSIFCQLYSEPKIISYISKNNFYPKPKPDSAIITFSSIRKNPVLKNLDIKLFSKIVKAGFCQPRKQLVNILSSQLNLTRPTTELWLKKNKLQPTQRAETLSLQNWLSLTRSFPNNRL